MPTLGPEAGAALVGAPDDMVMAPWSIRRSAEVNGAHSIPHR